MKIGPFNNNTIQRMSIIETTDTQLKVCVIFKNGIDYYDKHLKSERWWLHERYGRRSIWDEEEIKLLEKHYKIAKQKIREDKLKRIIDANTI